MTEYTKHVWPELQHNVVEISVSAEDYERARLAVEYCKGISNDTLASIVKCNRKLEERKSALLREQAE